MSLKLVWRVSQKKRIHRQNENANENLCEILDLWSMLDKKIGQGKSTDRKEGL